MAVKANAVQAVENEKKITRWLNNETVKQKFVDVLNKGADGFIASLLSLVNENPTLQKCEPETVLTASLTAATLKLPISKNLGFAYIVPYKGKAQFQMGWKGYVQLAERTGQYKTINADVVYEGQIEDVDFVTGKIVRGVKKSDKVIGYVAYIEMINGFSKTLYMDKETMESHAKKYSMSYAYDLKDGTKSSVWSSNFNAMATKTVLKLLISKYGIMSVDMQNAGMATALAADSSVITEDGQYVYVDKGGTFDAANKEINANANVEVFEAKPVKKIEPKTETKTVEAPF